MSLIHTRTDEPDQLQAWANLHARLDQQKQPGAMTAAYERTMLKRRLRMLQDELAEAHRLIRQLRQELKALRPAKRGPPRGHYQPRERQGRKG